MKFAPYHELAGRPHVVVDGSPTDGTALNVTHWPGYPPPPSLAADLSAQSAFLLLEQPDLVPAGVDLVSNNHFDQDGLVSIFALVDPDEAMPRRTLLEDVASAGDFATFRDRDAARVSMVISKWATADDLPEDYDELCGVVYADALERLAEVCDHVDRFRDLWAEEDACLTASEGRFTVAERPDVDLAIVTADDDAPRAGGHRFGGNHASGLHPMVVHNETERLVVATIRGGQYDVELRYEGWVQLRSRPLRLRRDLAPLAARLHDEEAGDARWTATDVGGLIPRLTSGEGESSIEPARFVDLLTDHLATAPPAWDPFTPRE